MPTVTMLKDKARALGLTVVGNKTDLTGRLLGHLEQKTYSEIKTLVPSGERCPKNKISLVELLINTEKPLTTVTIACSLEFGTRSFEINHIKEQIMYTVYIDVS